MIQTSGLRSRPHASLTSLALAMTALALGAKCGEPGAGGEEPIYERARGLSTDLTVGARGQEVRTLHAYLTSYGYFPNERLARDFPRWRPLVGSAPAADDVFDERTAEALRRLQEGSGLTPTGVADEPTRALLRTPRCAVPDGMPKLDPSDKFARLGGWPGKQALTWRILTSTMPSDVATRSYNMDGSPKDPSLARNLSSVQIAEDQITKALAAWTAQTNVTFVDHTGSSDDQDIQFQWGTYDCCAVTTTRLSNSPPPVWRTVWDITFDKSLNHWADDPAAPGGTGDIYTFAVHEVGHALGLDHSSFQTTKMQPSFNPDHNPLYTDDAVAISSLYDTYVPVGGAAKDIGVGPDGLPWIIGTNSSVYKFNGSGWVQTTEYAAGEKIAVDAGGVPWLVNAAHQIYRRTTTSPTSGSFQLVAGNGFANDIGTGGDNSVWIIGSGSGDQPAYKFNGSGWNPSSGTGVRIAVGGDGKPWIVKADDTVWRSSTSDVSGTWSQPQSSARVKDLGISMFSTSGRTDVAPNGYVWSVAAASRVGLAVFDEQSAVGVSPHNSPSASAWVTANQWSDLGPSGPAMAVAVGPNGEPWVISQDNAIHRSTK